MLRRGTLVLLPHSMNVIMCTYLVPFIDSSFLPISIIMIMFILIPWCSFILSQWHMNLLVFYIMHLLYNLMRLSIRMMPTYFCIVGVCVFNPVYERTRVKLLEFIMMMKAASRKGNWVKGQGSHDKSWLPLKLDCFEPPTIGSSNSMHFSLWWCTHMHGVATAGN